jgi:hypothetical protein
MKRKIKINKKIKSDLKKYPMVECRWLDIVSDASWQSMDNLKNTKLATCITKGHLLSQTKGITRIFGDYSLKDNSKTDIEEVGNTTVIPNSVIVEIKKYSCNLVFTLYIEVMGNFIGILLRLLYFYPLPFLFIIFLLLFLI